MIREKPLLKTGDHFYTFMFMKYFLDKAYTGLLFDMKNALVKRGLLDSKNGYMDLRSFLGRSFSEQFFFYTLMDKCFGNQYVKINGEELEQELGDGMPDYYMRRGNRVFVIECKDAQVAAEKKLSGDYDTIKEAVFDKYVRSGEGHDKGVTQLVSVITKKLQQIMRNLDRTVPNGMIYVFPIIVYFDNCFDVEGPSYMLNKEFRRQMGNVVIDGMIVKDVVMVNVDQMMRLENFFANDKLKLASVINDYLAYKNIAELNQVFPFNKFLFQEARKKGYELKKTKWFDEVYRDLASMDWIGA